MGGSVAVRRSRRSGPREAHRPAVGRRLDDVDASAVDGGGQRQGRQLHGPVTLLHRLQPLQVPGGVALLGQEEGRGVASCLSPRAAGWARSPGTGGRLSRDTRDVLLLSPFWMSFRMSRRGGQRAGQNRAASLLSPVPLGSPRPARRTKATRKTFCLEDPPRREQKSPHQPPALRPVGRPRPKTHLFTREVTPGGPLDLVRTAHIQGNVHVS